MTHTVVLVGCGAAKRDRYCAAKDLYTSTYFEKKRAYAEAVGDSWFILSAKHKLFDPDRWLAPYDMTMDDVADTEQWARFVGGELHHHCSRTVDDDVEVIVLAGRDYTGPLRSVLEELNIEYRCPFDDTNGIGDQLAWLTERIDAASDQERVMTDGGQCAGGTDHYGGAGDGQCLAIKASDGQRCTNGVYGTDEFCGHHKRASDVTTAIEESDGEWVRCRECGWQKAEWDGPDPPCCSWCGVRVSRRDYEVRQGGEA